MARSEAASSDTFTSQDQEQRHPGSHSAHEEDEPILTLRLLVYRHDSPGCSVFSLWSLA